MDIAKTTALVTGASRGIGRAFVTDLLRRDAAHVYATARDPEALADLVALDPMRVTPLRLDVTDAAEIAAAAEAVDHLDLLINNAGTLGFGSLLEADHAEIERDMEVNFYGVLDVTRAFLPALETGGGAILNLLTLVSFGSMAGIGGYCASKAAALSMTQAMRAELAPRGVAVHAAFPGAVDTDMIRAFEMPKTPPEDVARAALNAVEADEEDSFPDPMAREIGAVWLRDPKAVERRFASM